MTKFLNISTDTTLGGNAPSDELAVSQKAIKTYVDNHGGGGSVAIDNSTITKNSSDEIQAVAVIDQNTGIIKPWSGTGAEYEDISEIDPDTLYITDDLGLPATEIGQITEALNDKVDKGHQVIEFQEPTSSNNYTWYRKYADGWVEQGGFASNLAWNGYGAQSVITLPIVMKDSNYTVCATMSNNNTNWNYPGCRGWADSSTQIIVAIATLGNDQGTVYKVYWQVSGMAA